MISCGFHLQSSVCCALKGGFAVVLIPFSNPKLRNDGTFLTRVELLDKFKRELHSFFHQVVDVRPEDAVGLRADF